MELILTNGVLTMTSLELVAFINSQKSLFEAELTHSDFLKKVPKVLNGGEGNFSSTYLDVQNKERPCYKLPKREACLMAMSYSYELQAKIFDRWQELEAKVKPVFQVPTTLSEALRLAADQAETIEKQTLLIEQKKPAVEFVSRYVEAKSTKAISDVAKILGVKQSVFIAWLVKRQYIFKRSGGYLPYSTCEQYFEVKTGEAHGHTYHQTKFTPMGIEWISRKWIDYSESVK